MPQVGIENSVGQQALDVTDALIPRAFELFEGDARSAISLVELFGALLRIPLRFELRQPASNLFETHAIGPRVGTSIVGKLNLAAGHDVGNDLREIADLIVV